MSSSNQRPTAAIVSTNVPVRNSIPARPKRHGHGSRTTSHCPQTTFRTMGFVGVQGSRFPSAPAGAGSHDCARDPTTGVQGCWDIRSVIHLWKHKEAGGDEERQGGALAVKTGSATAALVVGASFVPFSSFCGRSSSREYADSRVPWSRELATKLSASYAREQPLFRRLSAKINQRRPRALPAARSLSGLRFLVVPIF